MFPEKANCAASKRAVELGDNILPSSVQAQVSCSPAINAISSTAALPLSYQSKLNRSAPIIPNRIPSTVVSGQRNHQPAKAISMINMASLKPKDQIHAPLNEVFSDFMLAFNTIGKKTIGETFLNLNRFYHQFGLNSYQASLLFPTKKTSLSYPHLPTVTEQTHKNFKDFYALRRSQLKVLDYGLHHFGLRRKAERFGYLKSFSQTLPKWLTPEGGQDRKLLLQMIESTALLGNKRVAVNLCETASWLLEHVAYQEQALRFHRSKQAILQGELSFAPKEQKSISFALAKPVIKSKQQSEQISHTLVDKVKTANTKAQKKIFTQQNKQGETLLYLAIQNKDRKQIANLLSEIKPLSADKKVLLLSSQLEHQPTSLQVAAHQHDFATMQALLDAMKHLSAAEKMKILNSGIAKSYSAFHLACKYGKVKIVTELLAIYAASLNKQELYQALAAVNDQGYSALFLAVKHQHLAVVKAILAAIENFDDKQIQTIFTRASHNIFSPLHIGIWHANLPIMQLLLDRLDKLKEQNRFEIFNFRDSSKSTLLHLAIEKNADEIAQKIIKRFDKLNQEHKNTLLSSTMRGGYSPLMMAVEDQNPALIRSIISAIFDRNDAQSIKAFFQAKTIYNTTALFLAASSMRALDHKKSPDPATFKAVLNAIVSLKDPEFLKEMLICLKKYSFESVLFVACKEGSGQIVEKLLQAMANFSTNEKQAVLCQLNCDGFSPIYIAAIKEHKEVIRAFKRLFAKDKALKAAMQSDIHQARAMAKRRGYFNAIAYLDSLLDEPFAILLKQS